MSEIKFTGRVGAKKMCLMKNKDFDSRHEAYYTTLELEDGQKVTVIDTTASMGLLEGETRYEAIKKGKRVIKEMLAKGIQGGNP